jgi:RIO-like serine/threonine protein kinase
MISFPPIINMLKGAHSIYRLDEKIGAGDFGAVYLSRDQNRNKVAIKVFYDM